MTRATTTKNQPVIERVWVGLEPKARVSFKLTGRTTRGLIEKVHTFKMSNVKGAAKLMAKCKGALVQTASSVNHPDEYDAPEDFTFDDYWDAIGKILGPSNEALVQWATLAVAANVLGILVPEQTQKHLVKARYFVTKQRPKRIEITSKGAAIVAAFVKGHLK